MRWDDVSTTRIFGLDFLVDTSIAEIADALERDGQANSSTWRIVVTANVDHLVRYGQSAVLRGVAEVAYKVLPDGAPIVWASRLLKCPIDQRLAGSDLFAAWWQRMVDAQRPVVMVASNEQLARELTRENPHCRCIVPPLFADDDAARVAAIINEVRAELAADAADAVVLGLSTVKSHLIVAGLIDSTPPPAGAPLLLLLGASAEFHIGQQRRAPKWVQKSGMEWFYRLVRDPRRLAKRYLIDDMAFLPMVWREWRSRRAQQ